MFNLLPQNLKQKIKSEYALRRMVVILSFVIFLQVSSIVFTLPLWFISGFKEKEAVLQKKYMDNSTLFKNTDSISDIVFDTNAKLRVINNVLSYPKFRPLVDIIIQSKSENIYISGINYKYTDVTTANIVIIGIANKREDLVAFVKTLEGTKVFQTVNLPVGNLAQDKNINFSIEISLI